MTEEIKTRQCLKCRQPKELNNFPKARNKFFPGGYSLICTSCLETIIKSDDLNSVDELMRYLNLPFDLDKWTFLYDKYKDKTLSAYLNYINDDKYKGINWAEENERWRLIREEEEIDSSISVINEGKMRKLRKKWSSEYDDEELLWLENFYNLVIGSQNVSTPILQEYASDLSEIELRIKKGLRAGVDVKKDMDARDNIIKIAKFDAANSKNAADFDSIGELAAYLERAGWHPQWHTEPQDSIDYLMNNIQKYLQRLCSGEGNIPEQIEAKRAVYNTKERLEEEENAEFVYTQETPDEYEGEDELAKELEVWEQN